MAVALHYCFTRHHQNMKDSFLLISEALPEVKLRTAAILDCERLRAWKNAHRDSFFFRDMIKAEGQRAWFEGYLERADDWMFLILVGSEPIGCMGFRLRDDQIDVYNVILGRPEYGGQGVMSQAFRIMCSFAQTRLRREIVARVLKKNPALEWYRKHGFDVISEEDTHYLIKLDENRFSPVAVQEITR